MFTISSILINVLISSFALTLLAISFKFTSSVRRAESTSKTLDDYALSVNLTIFIIVSVYYITSLQQISPKRNLQILATILTIIALRNILSKYNRHDFAATTQYLSQIILFATWIVIPGLVAISRSGLKLGMASPLNNDISNYIGVATEVLKSGFSNSFHYGSYNLNEFGFNAAYQLPVSVIAFFSSGSSLEPWKLTMPMLILSISLVGINLLRLTLILQNKFNPKKAILVTIVVLSLPMNLYIFSNYFFGQIWATYLSLSIVISTYKIYLVVTTSKKIMQLRNLPHIAELSTSGALSIYCYPHMLIPIFAISLAILAIAICVKLRKLHSIALPTFIFSLSIIFSLPYISNSIALAITQSKIYAGWPLPIWNPLSMFFMPQLINFDLSIAANLFIWIIAIAVYIAVMKVTKAPTTTIIQKIILFTSTAVITFGILLRGRELNEYSSWKLVSYFFPLIAVVLIERIFNQIKNYRFVFFFVLGLSTLSPTIIWSSGINNSLYTSKLFVEATNSSQVNRLDKVNIKLNNFFETMNAAAIITGPKVFLSSPNYYPVTSDPEACTLVRLSAYPSAGVIPINAEYGLLPNSKSGC